MWTFCRPPASATMPSWNWIVSEREPMDAAQDICSKEDVANSLEKYLILKVMAKDLFSWEERIYFQRGYEGLYS